MKISYCSLNEAFNNNNDVDDAMNDMKKKLNKSLSNINTDRENFYNDSNDNDYQKMIDKYVNNFDNVMNLKKKRDKLEEMIKLKENMITDKSLENKNEPREIPKHDIPDYKTYKNIRENFGPLLNDNPDNNNDIILLIILGIFIIFILDSILKIRCGRTI